MKITRILEESGLDVVGLLEEKSFQGKGELERAEVFQCIRVASLDEHGRDEERP